MIQSSFVIDLRVSQLRTFAVVADELHFGRAAARLGLAQSAVSQQVSRLEDALGARLLSRTSRQVSLTPAGELVHAEAAALVAAVDGLARRAREAAAGDRGTVSLGAQAAALIWPVPMLLARLRAEAPGLRVNVHHRITEEQIAALRAGVLDLGLVRDAEAREGIILEELRREPVMAVLPRTHRLAGRRRLRLAELAGDAFVLWVDTEPHASSTSSSAPAGTPASSRRSAT